MLSYEPKQCEMRGAAYAGRPIADGGPRSVRSRTLASVRKTCVSSQRSERFGIVAEPRRHRCVSATTSPLREIFVALAFGLERKYPEVYPTSAARSEWEFLGNMRNISLFLSTVLAVGTACRGEDSIEGHVEVLPASAAGATSESGPGVPRNFGPATPTEASFEKFMRYGSPHGGATPMNPPTTAQDIAAEWARASSDNVGYALLTASAMLWLCRLYRRDDSEILSRIMWEDEAWLRSVEDLSCDMATLTDGKEFLFDRVRKAWVPKQAKQN